MPEPSTPWAPASLTPDGIRAELLEAFREADRHGDGRCSCCDPATGAALEHAIVTEVRYALDRYRPGEGSGAVLDDTEINAMQLLAIRDAIVGARLAIIDRAVLGLTDGPTIARLAPAPRAPWPA